MRAVPRLALFALTWTLPVAHAGAPMGYDDARHLLARTGFGPTDAEIRTFAALPRTDAVARILGDARAVATTAPPVWTAEVGPLRPPGGASAGDEERKAFRREQVRRGLELRAWWVQEMLVTPSPLTERMTLFWHNHFVSSQQKVRVARLMYVQNATLRANALGNFGTLLHVASKDPAMLVYLDGAQNRKGAPNENFAREVMELFTLGEGNYTEHDIQEAARAFTGWSLDRATGEFLYRPGIHDNGSKTVLGRTGNLDGDAVLDVLLARPETAQHITTKLWREFVSPDPDPREVRHIAQAFGASHYDIKVVLRGLLTSAAFWSAENRGTLVKSPAEFVVGTLRQLAIDPASALPFAVLSAGMGQNLFSPPNVAGWPGGNAWIDSNTLLARKQFVDRVARADEAPPQMLAIVGRWPEEPMAIRAAPAELREPAVAPRSALAPLGAAADDRERALRFQRQVDRSLRDLHFNAAQWLGSRKGATTADRERAAQKLLLPLPPQTPPLPPQTPPPPDSDAASFVRATLLDPAFELK
ncbi:MAG TPA: DUF1800 domain-containing protein [Casimicrobiaceae bacterium]